jgi:hypothetical protein
MQTQPAAPARSPISGIFPEPVTVHHHTEATQRRLAVRPIAHGTTRPPPSRWHSSQTGTLLARVRGLLRNDKRGASTPPKDR